MTTEVIGITILHAQPAVKEPIVDKRGKPRAFGND